MVVLRVVSGAICLGFIVLLLGGCASKGGSRANFSKPATGVCQAYDPEMALLLGRLSAIAYESKLRKQREQMAALGLTFDREIRDKEYGTQGFLTYNDRVAVVVLTGTEDVKDLLQDAQVWTQEGRKDPLCGKTIEVHNGFYRAISRIRKDETLFVRLTQLHREGRKIYFTGHSLGGALATLLAYFTALDHPDIDIAGIYTFGQPVTGTGSFRKCYDARLRDRTFRFVNQNDAIVRLSVGKHYEHVGVPLYFDTKGNFAEQAKFDPFRDVKDFFDTQPVDAHKIDVYLEHLEKNRTSNPFNCS